MNLALQGVDSFVDYFLMLQCVGLLLEALQEYKYKNIESPKQINITQMLASNSFWPLTALQYLQWKGQGSM